MKRKNRQEHIKERNENKKVFLIIESLFPSHFTLCRALQTTLTSIYHTYNINICI